MERIISKSIILQITYDDCTRNAGGVNSVIRMHQRIALKNGCTCICLFPIRLGKMPKVDENTWGIVIDGEYFGARNTSWICNQIKFFIEQKFFIREVFIHHIYNIKYQAIEEWLDIVECRITFIVHDNYSICVSFNLLKNNQNYCGNPHIYNSKCNDCIYYINTIKNRKVFSNFLDRYADRIRIVTPSNFTTRLWSEAFQQYMHKVITVPHQVVKESGKKLFEWQPQYLRVAYMGVQQHHKGWDVWKNVVKGVSYKNTIFQFYYFGIGKELISNVKNIYVDTSKNPRAMVDALEENKIDIVILWSLCPETYCFTYYEALNAGVFVITNKDSGNIADQVKKNENGLVVEYKELLNLFEKEEKLKELVLSFKKEKRVYEIYDNEELFQYKEKEKKKAKFLKTNISSAIINIIYCLKFKLKNIKVTI